MKQMTAEEQIQAGRILQTYEEHMRADENTGLYVDRDGVTRAAGLKPLVLLDVDGVVNAWPDNGSERHQLRLQGMRVLVSDETLEALRGVFRAAHEVLWCTAWRGAANDFMRFLREQNVTTEHRLDWVSDGLTLRTGGFTTKWKLPAVRATEQVWEAQKAGRPIYWIEDFGWGIEHHHSSMKYTDITQAGITPIDTAKEGQLLLTHLEGTPFE